MNLGSDAALQARLIRCSNLLVVGVIAISGTVLTIWVSRISVPSNMGLTIMRMNPVSAFSLMMCGLSFLILTSRKSSGIKMLFGYILAAFVSANGLLRLLGFRIGETVFRLHFADNAKVSMLA